MKIMPSPERLGLFMVCPSVNNAEKADGGVSLWPDQPTSRDTCAVLESKYLMQGVLAWC